MPLGVPRYNKILTHPYKDKIDFWLFVENRSSRWIELELKRLFVGNKALQCGHVQLTGYSKAYRELYISQRKARGASDIIQGDMATRIADILGIKVKPEAEPHIYTDEELIQFRDGISGLKLFCDKVVKWKSLPVDLQMYQVEMANVLLGNNRVAFVTGRQIGKDFMIALFCLWDCICNPNRRIVIASAAERQNTQINERFLTFIASSYELVESIQQNTTELIRFKNGSVVYFLPATGLIRGYTEIDRIFANEARDIPDSCFDALYPMLAITGGQMVLTSTPLGTRGHLWEVFNNPLYSVRQYPTRINKWVDKEWLEQERKSHTSEMFRVEYEAQFSELINAFFDAKLVDRASMDDYDFVLEKQGGKRYSMGIDWARLRDTSVITIVSRNVDNEFKIEYIKPFSHELFSTQIGFIEYLDEKFEPFAIIPEYAGLGIAPSDDLKKSLGSKVNFFTPKISTRLKAYEIVKRELERKNLIWPHSWNILTTQLKMFQFEVTGDGRIKVSKSKAGTASDDYADSLAFAMWPFAKKIMPRAVSVNI